MNEFIVNQLIDRLTMISWDVDAQFDDVKIEPDDPSGELFAALEILERDLRESYQQQRTQLEELVKSEATERSTGHCPFGQLGVVSRRRRFVLD